MTSIKLPTAKLSILSAALLLSACSGGGDFSYTTTTNVNGKLFPDTFRSYGRFVLSELEKLPYTTLVYNGFSAQASDYNSAPLNLAGDLSAAAPENLYFLDYFKQMSKAPQPQDYEITLPASGKKIHTTLTILDPNRSMKNQTSAKEIAIIPTSDTPVILSIPAGRAEMPETPFFPEGTLYTGVIAEKPRLESDNHTAILSIEANADNPVVFGAFAHYPGTHLNLRVYDKDASVDTSKPEMPLLSKSSQPGVIQARFVSLTADNLPSLSLKSMDQSAFEDLGSSSGYLVSIMHSLFPKLTEQRGDEIYTLYNPAYGIFCLGGDNNFHQVDLQHQTFVYPMSAADRQTQITTVTASADSGFIVESGKHLKIGTLTGSNTLKLIAVMEDPAASSSVLEVQRLNNIDTVNVVFGNVKDGWSPPPGGFVLLTHNNDQELTLQIDEDAHMNGYLYEGQAEHRNKQVILTALNRKGALGSGVVHRLLAGHPEMQGLSGHTVRGIAAKLDPIHTLKRDLARTSACAMSHFVNLPLFAPTNGFNVVGKEGRDASIVSTHINYKSGALGIAVATYGAVENAANLTLGNSITVFSPIMIKGNIIAPSISIGHELNRSADIVEAGNGVRIQLQDVSLNSYFARAMAAFQHHYAANRVSLAIGLETRQARLWRGLAVTDHTRFSINGETFNSLNTIFEAQFQTRSADFKVSLWNANHVQLQVGLTY